jgi:GNAT superfamily N-acetyltransferase
MLFSPVVPGMWNADIVMTPSADGIVVVVDPDAADDRSVSLVHVTDGPRILTVSPSRAVQLSIEAGSRIASDDLAPLMASAGITLNDPDHLYYFTVDEQARLLDEPTPTATRVLTFDDAHEFSRFTDAAPEADVEEAYVELDHWLVVGTFVDDRLVSAASMYPWGAAGLADIGVLTLPAFRGRGLGRATVRAAAAAAITAGREPQYRCQTSNDPSVRLADAAGLTLFGDWWVVLPVD